MVKKQFTFLCSVAALILFAKSKGWELTGGELWRTPEMVEIYKKSGKSQVSHSLHQDRLAIDLNLFIGGKWMDRFCQEWKILGDHWMSLNPANRWGGDWNKNGKVEDEKFLDLNHFEMQ